MVAGLICVAVVLVLGIRETVDRSAHLPQTSLAFDLPAGWDTADAEVTFDEAWAARQKEKYPQDGPLIDSLVEGLKSGDAFWFARIDVNADRDSDGWVLVDVADDDTGLIGVPATAKLSVTFQQVHLRPGTTTTEVTLPAGHATRLDWSYELRVAGGPPRIGSVRSYWIVDGTKLAVIQLTFYDDQPAVLASFEAAIQTLRSEVR